jgi:pSer/pThr/pTyr-binding forkhead associated (FHA) protein
MYIESAGLSERHALLQYVDDTKYVLRDWGSDSGTWVRVRDIDLYTEPRCRQYKVGNTVFTIEESKDSFLYQKLATTLTKLRTGSNSMVCISILT